MHYAIIFLRVLLVFMALALMSVATDTLRYVDHFVASWLGPYGVHFWTISVVLALVAVAFFAAAVYCLHIAFTYKRGSSTTNTKH